MEELRELEWNTSDFWKTTYNQDFPYLYLWDSCILEFIGIVPLIIYIIQ